MQTYQINTFARPDTMLGVCEALGEDFRINANLLRVGFALPMFHAPLATVGAYLALGLLVFLTRLALPNPRLAPADRTEPALAGRPRRPSVEAEPELALAA